MATSINNMEDENSSENSSCIFPGYTDVNDFSQKTLRAVLTATRSSNDLPVGDDFDFYSTFRSVRDVLDIEGRRILMLLQKLLRHQNVKGNLHIGDSAELEDQFDVLMDANDQILEMASTELDEASGIHKEETKLVIASASTSQPKPSTSWNKKPAIDASKPATAYRLMTARNIHRPQLRFRDKVDNSNHPYKPQIRNKPHALKSVEESLKLPEGVSLEDAEREDFVYPHPYAHELEAFKPTSSHLQKVDPQEPTPLNLTPLIMIDTVKQLNEMIENLKKQAEIAVDLEHHSYRSFQGLTCLMQISTRSHDYIIDTLELRNDIHMLNEVFADPSITKVFHGADSDIVWLQRDFGVYIVNMFDTGQAARVLGLSRFSLAHLMMNYCHIEADKQFQMADWRIRPLPSELINYAREDTHYLLYIYDMMRNQLIDRGNEQSNLLVSVYDRSKNVAAKVYQKPVFTDTDYMELYRKSKKVFNSQQLMAMKELYQWRDRIARLEDESLGYVLPNHMLLQIAEILPRERQGILACCNPIPPLVRQSLIDLHGMVLQAREISVIKSETAPKLQPTQLQHPKYNVDSLLNCPHDMSRLDEQIADTEQRIMNKGLISSSASMFSNISSDIVVTSLPVITAFSQGNDQAFSRTLAQKKTEEVRASFADPFAKYLPKDLRPAVKPQHKEIWKMKAATGNKRKADRSKEKMDLDSFEPEFIPPQKKPKITVNLKEVQVTTKSSTSGSSLFRVPDSVVSKTTVTSTSLFRTPDNVSSTGTEDLAQEKKKKKTGQYVEKQIKSLRQEVTMKKKKDKKKKINKEKQKEEQVKSDVTNASNLNNSNISTCPLTSQTTEAVGENSGAIEAKKQDKKKKKKKLTVTEVEQNFTAFDYSAAEKSKLKDKKSNKKADIYNPSLPSRSGKHKDKARKPKLAGPKSNVSVSFGPSGSAQVGKKKKKS